MRVELKKEKFLITLPKRLHVELTELNKQHERVNLDLAALILHFILKQQSEPQEWMPLSSDILRKYDHGGYKSSEQVELLKERGFIEYLNHQNNITGKENSCRRFRISLKYFEQEKGASNSSIHTYEIKQRPLLEKITKYHKKRKIEAKSSTYHLTKWLESEGFTINKEAALEYINNQKLSEYEYNTRYNKIINFDPARAYSRDGKDERLHSLFTQLPSDLKQFVKFRGNQLVEVDIKSSQPLMFAILLEKILLHFTELENGRYGVTKGRLKNRIQKSINTWINNKENGYYNNDKYVLDTETISIDITIILLERFEPPDFAEIHNFISLVYSGTIYEHIGEALLSTGGIWKGKEKFHTLLFSKKESKQKVADFDTLRDCGKQILLNALYSPARKGSIEVINKVKELFPSVFRLVNAFKIISYKDLSLILQRMEAQCIIDHCAKNIAEKHTDMPLICRHDSLSTTKQYSDALFDEFKKQIDAYFGTPIKLEKEIW